MNTLGIEIPRSKPAYSVEEAEKLLWNLVSQLLSVLHTMGGTGGGLVYNLEELKVVAGRDCI